MMSHERMETMPPVQMKTLDNRFIVMQQSVDRHQHPIVVIDIFSVDMQRQATVKVGFKDLGTLRLTLQSFMDTMLESMCDY